MTDPVTPARQVVEFARGVLSVELEHWQAEALEGLVTSYGTACVMISRADEKAAEPAAQEPAMSGVASWQPQHRLRGDEPHPAALRGPHNPLTDEPGELPPDSGPWPHGDGSGEKTQAVERPLGDPLGGDDHG